MKLKHPNVITFFGIFEYHSEDLMVTGRLLMLWSNRSELMDLGSLRDYVITNKDVLSTEDLLLLYFQKRSH